MENKKRKEETIKLLINIQNNMKKFSFLVDYIVVFANIHTSKSHYIKNVREGIVYLLLKKV